MGVGRDVYILVICRVWFALALGALGGGGAGRPIRWRVYFVDTLRSTPYLKG